MNTYPIEALMRSAIHEIETLEVPTRIVIASDIWTKLRASTEFVKTGDLGRNSFDGLPMEMNHGLADGEWFTHDRAGKVLNFRGDEKRIRLVARAYRTSRFHQ